MAERSTVRKRWAVDRQQLVILLVAAVMAASFLLLILYPQERELSALRASVTRERELVSQKVLTSRDGLYVSARTAALRQVQDQLDRRLPPETRVAEFLQQIDECVRAEPGITHEVQCSDVPASGPIPAASLHLQLTGPFDAVYRCLARIETLERLNRVRRLGLKRHSAAGIVASADLLIYYLPLQAAEPSEAPPAQETETDLPAGQEGSVNG
ncbi:MAG TPA: hypothetical protein VMY69_00340 [Phycisphaerae bacterium]|nr:hypothetical protein [Phycisphaerae bacterium]